MTVGKKQHQTKENDQNFSKVWINWNFHTNESRNIFFENDDVVVLCRNSER